MVLEEDKEAMYERPTKGKHAMFLHMVPVWNSLRPFSLMGMRRQSRTTGLRRFLLAEQCLEIKNGRCVRKKRQQCALQSLLLSHRDYKRSNQKHANTHAQSATHLAGNRESQSTKHNTKYYRKCFSEMENFK